MFHSDELLPPETWTYLVLIACSTTAMTAWVREYLPLVYFKKWEWNGNRNMPRIENKN
jgi:hypothetical protein